jgi:hypothetical protein
MRHCSTGLFGSFVDTSQEVVSVTFKKDRENFRFVDGYRVSQPWKIDLLQIIR